MAYRLVPAGKNQLIALGGEDRDEDKTPSLELLTPANKPLSARADVATTQASNIH